MAKPLQKKQEAFARAVVLNGGDKPLAYETAGYSMKMSTASIGVEADKIYNNPKITLRIRELQKIELTVVVKSKEAKLLALEKIFSVCMTLDTEKGMVNAPSAIAAIKEHNLMQGDNAPTLSETTHKVDEPLAARLTGASKR
tara:strand:+ start:355 stop:780 length:426 start_codon:yes stop_codon:yes gene_type:complete